MELYENEITFLRFIITAQIYWGPSSFNFNRDNTFLFFIYFPFNCRLIIKIYPLFTFLPNESISFTITSSFGLKQLLRQCPTWNATFRNQQEMLDLHSATQLDTLWRLSSRQDPKHRMPGSMPGKMYIAKV